MKKTVVEYITDTLEDIPKQSLQENRIRLNAFFSEQETIEKRDGRYIFRYAFILLKIPEIYPTKFVQGIRPFTFKNWKSIHPGRISDMEYKDVVLYGEDSTPVAQKRLAEYLKENNGLKIQFLLMIMMWRGTARGNSLRVIRNCRKRYSSVKGRSVCSCSFPYVICCLISAFTIYWRNTALISAVLTSPGSAVRICSW